MLAPTGTIGFMMDCDTTGVEPDIALVKYKKLVGGGMSEDRERHGADGARKLGYGAGEVRAITQHIDEHETIEGAPALRDEHLPVFDCAFRPANGERSIHWMGHIRMMGAVQPFLSGAISKTVNLPNDARTEDLMDAYLAGWKLGLKALAVYRDGSKRTQPLNAGQQEGAGTTAAVGDDNVIALPGSRARRKKLPDERPSVTHKFVIAGTEGYLTIGHYPDGSPGEIFLRMAKEGSTVSGLMDTIATMTSISLQYGVPLQALVEKFSHTRFEPAGVTNNREIPLAKSITDYVFRYIGNRYLSAENAATETAAAEASAPDASVVRLPEPSRGVVAGGASAGGAFVNQADAPACIECGAITVRAGACYKCPNCGAQGGCG